MRALREAAEREQAKARGRLDRVRRDYQDGKLATDDWAEQREELGSELQAAEPKLQRLSAREQEVAEATPADELEENLLAWLTDVRAAVVGAIRDAKDVPAVSAALLRLFDRFVLHPVDHGGNWWAQPDVLGESPLAVMTSGDGSATVDFGYVVEPVPRPEALINGEFVLRRVPLSPPVVNVPISSGNKESKGFPFESA